MTNNKPVALIVDDEKDIRELIQMAFLSVGVECVLAPSVVSAISFLKKQEFDFCITDMRLPDGDGIDLIAHIQKHYELMPVCMITGHGNMELAIKALKLGAFDFVSKPFDLKQLRNMARSALKLGKNVGLTKNSSVNNNHGDSSSEVSAINIIGNSDPMKKIAVLIRKLARSQAPVLIRGESGTGKELIARSIHEQSARKEYSFVAVNCGAIPENLLESEFFGYKKGAFTGAEKDKDGLFFSANKGTLFLDEVADLPLAMQVKLLRAIQEKNIRPIGGIEEIPIDVRILSATHKDLEKLIQEGLFREDLYYRLNVISIVSPSLRNRKEDIPLLVDFILKKLAKLHQMDTPKISKTALNLLSEHDFPGNVRELENILERAITFLDDEHIEAEDIHFGSQIITG